MIQKTLLLVLLISSQNLFSQQLPQYSQWYANQFVGNPSHAGIKRCIDVHTLYRNQWVGFSGAPKSGFLTVSIPLYKQRKQYLSARHGTGFKFERDEIGQFSTSRLNIAYAAHFNFDKYKRLSLGLYGGVVQMGYNPATVHVANIDPAVLSEASIVAPDASFGTWFNDQNYFVGLSLLNLIPTKWNNVGVNSKNFTHINLNAGYRLGANDNMSFIPAFMLRVPTRGKANIDLNLLWDYKNTLSLGLGYRSTDALIAFVSIKINSQFALNYSFDYTLSDIQKAAKNTHEISIRFSTCKIKKERTASCPLF
ncbi:MAG TPA: type IX secretion system membrane protein PorP/SprF [Crocinitomicaceae bacterium]|nr:type IX secretion system membrane protein PorP/SprF [Crocinitomicaceae bacterium]